MRVNIVPTFWNHWKRNAQSLDTCLKRTLLLRSQSQWLGNRSLSQKDWTLGSVGSSYSLEVVADLELCLHWFRCCKIYNFKHFYMYLVPWFFVFNTWDFTNGTSLQSQVKQRSYKSGRQVDKSSILVTLIITVPCDQECKLPWPPEPGDQELYCLRQPQKWGYQAHVGPLTGDIGAPEHGKGKV